MARVTRSRRVEEDLLGIAEHIVRDNPQAAARWLDEIERTFSLLADFPTIGQEVGHIRPGLRRFCVGNYVIYFEPSPNGVRLVRVLHGSRRIEGATEF